MSDLSISIKDPNGREVDQMAISQEALGDRVRPTLIHHAVVAYGRNLRLGTASTKTRAEIRKSNHKPWSQKGTGRARCGTRRSPLWRGGGVVFGPKPRKYTRKLNRKQKKLATRSAMLWKLQDGQVMVVDSFQATEPKTKAMAAKLGSLGIQGSCLIGLESVDRNMLLSVRNLPGVKVVPVKDFNAYDITRYKTVLLTRESMDLFMNPRSAPADQPGKEDDQ